MNMRARHNDHPLRAALLWAGLTAVVLSASPASGQDDVRIPFHAFDDYELAELDAHDFSFGSLLAGDSVTILPEDEQMEVTFQAVSFMDVLVEVELTEPLTDAEGNAIGTMELDAVVDRTGQGSAAAGLPLDRVSGDFLEARFPVRPRNGAAPDPPPIPPHEDRPPLDDFMEPVHLFIGATLNVDEQAEAGHYEGMITVRITYAFEVDF